MAMKLIIVPKWKKDLFNKKKNKKLDYSFKNEKNAEVKEFLAQKFEEK